MNNHPIGIFDSGVGGTSIWKELHACLPLESTIYLADSKNAPYGTKGRDKIIELSARNTEWLLAQGCKLIIAACNTATTNAIDYLRTQYKVPFIGIEPAIKPAALKTQTNAIGILATKGTLSSALFHKTTVQFASHIKVIEQEGTGIVELIESGRLDSESMQKLLKKYTAPMLRANIDHLVLGCTHYPYLIPQLQKLLPINITIIDSGAAVALQTKRILDSHGLCTDGTVKPTFKFFTNGDTQVLTDIVGLPYKVEVLGF